MPDDSELRGIAHELQDWLEAKKLTPRQAIVVQTMALAEFFGYCARDRATMNRTLEVAVADIRTNANLLMDQKERGKN